MKNLSRTEVKSQIIKHKHTQLFPLNYLTLNFWDGYAHPQAVIV